MEVFFFLKTLFKKLIVEFKGRHKLSIKNKIFSNYTKIHCIRGIKFMMGGKLKRKARKSFIKILAGLVPCQKISSTIHYSKLHTYNRYGAYGLKL